MLEKVQSAKERWGGVSDVIDRWLQERQDMLVQYCELSSATSFDEHDDTQCNQLRQLCQIMMDYTSAGHFEIYGKLIREAKDFNDQSALDEADLLYSRVEKTTDSVLDFNDKYQETDDFTSLQQDLSQIGERLASRFEAEDRMISVLHESHRDLVA